MAFIDDIRQELIDDGEATKMLLDYIDERIKMVVQRAFDNDIGEVIAYALTEHNDNDH